MSRKKGFLILGILLFTGLLGGCEKANELLMKDNNSLTEEEVVQALKEALTIGADSVTNWLHRVDAYYKDSLIKILFPPEARDIKNTLIAVGMTSLVEDFELKLNRAAEDAATKAKPIFFNAIANLTIQDGISILHGSDTAATNYLRVQTYDSLYSAFYPEIRNSLSKVGAQNAWNTIATTYNTLTGQNVNTDISDYTTHKALYGLFLKIAEEEKAIRHDPLKRVTDLLKKVFGSLDNG
jgi:hypothetical protein